MSDTVLEARNLRVLYRTKRGPVRAVDGVSFDLRAGETLGLLDESKIPSELRGYVAVALERGLIDTEDGPMFNPKDDVPRVDAARFLLRLLELK